MAEPRTHHEHGAGHETVDTPPRVPIYAMLVTLAVLLIGAVVTSALLATVWRSAPEPPSPFAGDAPRVTGAPALQAHPSLDMAILSAQMQRQIDRVEWVDREAGIVRMPVDRAMTLLARRGLPQDAAASGAGDGGGDGS